MSGRSTRHYTLLAFLTLILSAVPTARSYATLIANLKSDYSDTLNPNGSWAYYADTGNYGVGLYLLPHTNSNGVGYEGFGNLLGEPSVFACPGIAVTTCIFPSFHEGLFIRWTLPADSTVSVDGFVRFIPPPRDPYPATTFTQTIGGFPVTFHANPDPNLFEFTFDSPFIFPAGTLVEFYARSLACCGYFAEYDITIKAADIPEPGTLTLFGTGLAALVGATRRRRNHRRRTFS